MYYITNPILKIFIKQFLFSFKASSFYAHFKGKNIFFIGRNIGKIFSELPIFNYVLDSPVT